ncbi:MAG: hypothetical protein LBP19_02020 [Treponema sp.]|nr:hypothetical protein [Treponema sp.]
MTTIVLPDSFIREVTFFFQKRLPEVLYFTILMSLSYAARRKISCPVSMLCVFILATGFTALSWMLIDRIGDFNPPPLGGKTITLGEKGLILSSNDGAIVLLNGPQEYPRLLVMPGVRAEYHQSQDDHISGTVPAVNALFFRNAENDLITGVWDKFHMVSLKFETLLTKSFPDFMLYAGALILLLVSMRFIMNISSWHFANLLAGVVFFGGILYFEVFIDSPQMQRLLSAAINDKIPADFISPAIFYLIGLLFIIATVLLPSLSKKSQRKRRGYA